jgi:iron complex outermembrane receptor protein
MGKQKMGFIFKGILAGLLAVLFMVPAVYAQDEEEDTFMLEEITVTAEKREGNLQKVPISIQTVDGVELVTEAKQRIDEIMQGVVGVSSQGSQVGTSFFMRGLGNADFGPPVAGIEQSAVAVLIDGVYQNRGEVVRGGTLDMARAEVMRGTQSTTLGGSSLAGAVSLVSNDPVFEYEGFGSLGIGNYNLTSTQGVLNVPLADNHAARIAFSTEKRDGYLSSNAGNSDLTNARLKYRWQPTEAFNIVASVNHQIVGGNGVDTSVLTYSGKWEGYDPTKADEYGIVMGDPPIFGHVEGVDYEDRDDPWDDGYPADQWPNSPFRHTTIDQYSADIDWDLDIGTLTVTPSFQQAHFRSSEPPRGNSFRSEDRKQETTQLDMQLTSPPDALFEWLAGIYYYDTTYWGTIRGTGYNGDGGGPGCSRAEGAYYGYCWSSTDPNEQTSYSAYANITYPVLDTLRANAGVRYTKDEKYSRGSGGVSGTNAGPSGEYVYNPANEGEWDDVTYRVGAEYDMNDQSMLYVMYATGYQPGSFTFGSTTEAQTLEQWTAGIKSRFLQNRFQLNVEGFHSTYHNRPMQGGLSYYSDGYTGGTRCGDPFPGGAPFTYNGEGNYCYSYNSPPIPDLTSSGVDVEINFLITENDRFDASVEYLQSEQGGPTVSITASQLEANGFSAADAAATLNALASQSSAYDGLTLQNSPEWSANASYSHVFEMPDGSTMTPKINAEYRDTYWSQGGGPGANIVQPGNSIQDAYTLWNVFLNWTSSDDKFNISAYIKNIEDKPILTNLGAGAPGSPVEYVTLAPPRTFGVVLSVNL